MPNRAKTRGNVVVGSSASGKTELTRLLDRVRFNCRLNPRNCPLISRKWKRMKSTSSESTGEKRETKERDSKEARNNRNKPNDDSAASPEGVAARRGPESASRRE